MSSPKTRREQYSDATRAALLESATRMFATTGFAATSLDDIATATQVTRGAVYHHFANKQALFAAVIDAQAQIVVAEAVAAALTGADPWSGGMAALDAVLDRCCDPVYGRLCWIEAPAALGYENWMQFESDRMLGMIETFVAAVVEAGELPADQLRPSAEMTFHLVAGAGRSITLAADGDRAAVRADLGAVIKAMIAGLRTRR